MSEAGKRAEHAFTRAAFSNIVTTDQGRVTANTGNLDAVIFCHEGTHGVMFDLALTASHAHLEEAKRTLNYLSDLLDTQASDSTGRPVGQKLWTDRSRYQPFERILVYFEEIPEFGGHAWITVVPASARPGDYQQWFQTEGKTRGQFEFRGLDVGTYEVRLHSKSGDREVRLRHAFAVGGSAAVTPETPRVLDSGIVVRTEKQVYTVNEQIAVTFQGLPADTDDEWITVVPYDAAAGAYKQWFYTNQKKSGTLDFHGLPAGEYEVRYYRSFDDKQTRAAYRFTVRAN